MLFQERAKQRRRLSAICCLLLVALAGCADHQQAAPLEHETVTTSETRSVPRQPTELGKIGDRTAGQTGPNSSKGDIYRGSGQFYNPQLPTAAEVTTTSAGDVSLNFVNADVKEVAKGVLGDLLGLNYLVDPSVQGTVTIQTSQSLQKKDILPAFEAALRASGLALVSQGGLYSVVPYGSAGRLGSPNSSARNYGTEIVQLHYISPEQMRRVLEPIVPQGTIVEVDQSRNLLVIGGTDGERAAIRENIKTFDADWLAGMSFALFTPRIATAKQLVDDLNHVMGDENSPIAGQVRLIPIERMNAVLAIAPQPHYLEELRTWVNRLDQGNATTDRRIYVYYVQNGRASDLASVLGSALGIKTTGGTSQTQSQVARSQPSSQGLTQMSSGNTGFQGQGGALGSAGSSPFGSTASSVQPARPAGTPGEGSNSSTNNDQPGGLSITPDEVNNALLVVATPAEYDVINAALTKLDILPLQVLIEAAIAEVTLTNDLRFGVQWLFNNGKNQGTFTDASGLSVAPQLPGFAYIYNSGTKISAVLSALENVTHVDVLSSPKLMVLNNQTATLQVGDQVPIATQSAVGTLTAGAPIVNSIEYKDTGVILSVTPRVNEGGLVLMDVSQEVSDVSQTTTSNLNSPTINQRKIGSTVAVQDGETIALGGLIRDDRTIGRTGIPYLQDIPILGHLFGDTQNNHTRTELLVLITPRVVRDGRGAAAVTEELRSKMMNLHELSSLH